MLQYSFVLEVQLLRLNSWICEGDTYILPPHDKLPDEPKNITTALGHLHAPRYRLRFRLRSQVDLLNSMKVDSRSHTLCPIHHHIFQKIPRSQPTRSLPASSGMPSGSIMLSRTTINVVISTQNG